MANLDRFIRMDEVATAGNSGGRGSAGGDPSPGAWGHEAEGVDAELQPVAVPLVDVGEIALALLQRAALVRRHDREPADRPHDIPFSLYLLDVVAQARAAGVEHRPPSLLDVLPAGGDRPRRHQEAILRVEGRDPGRGLPIVRVEVLRDERLDRLARVRPAGGAGLLGGRLAAPAGDGRRHAHETEEKGRPALAVDAVRLVARIHVVPP